MITATATTATKHTNKSKWNPWRAFAITLHQIESCKEPRLVIELNQNHVELIFDLYFVSFSLFFLFFLSSFLVLVTSPPTEKQSSTRQGKNIIVRKPISMDFSSALFRLFSLLISPSLWSAFYFNSFAICLFVVFLCSSWRRIGFTWQPSTFLFISLYFSISIIPTPRIY